MLKHSDDCDITSAIELILVNLPSDISILESIRMIYIKLGRLFSYDYNIANDLSLARREVNYEKIDNYQTCKQISDILATCIRYISSDVKCNIIERKANIRGVNGESHKALGVSFKEDGYDYNLLLDLTLDLFRIQGGMQTKQFAYTTDASSKYDIISLNECEFMDKKLGLSLSYTDEDMKIVKDILDKSSALLEDKISYIGTRFNRRFMGAHEALLYYKELFITLLDVPFKEFSLTKDNNGSIDMISLFRFEVDGKEIYYLLDKNSGLELTSPSRIRKLLSCGYNSKSMTLMTALGDSKKVI